MRTRRTLILAVALVVLLALAPSILAQSPAYDLSWWTVDAGGYTFSTGGSYALGGTIGQPDAGPTLSNGRYSLTGGFWTGVTALERYPVYLPLVVRNQITVP